MERLLSRSWFSDAPLKGSRLDAWGAGLSLQWGVRWRFWGEYWEEVLWQFELECACGGRGTAKFSSEEAGLFVVHAARSSSTRFGRGTLCSGVLVVCRVDGRWNTNLGGFCAGLRSGKRRRTASFLFSVCKHDPRVHACYRVLSVKSSTWYLFMSVCVVTALRCVFSVLFLVCMWRCLLVMQRSLYTLLRCMRALHFFGPRC